MPKRGRTSVIWDYFTVSSEDPEKAICLVWDLAIRRGGEGKGPATFTTRSLWRHLKGVCLMLSD